MTAIDASRILIMATDGFEQSELTEPLQRLQERGATVKVAAPARGTIRGWDRTDWGDTVAVDMTVDQVKAEDFDALVLPGGQINPDKLRTDDRAVALVRRFVESGKPVAAICHGPWLLVEADVLRGRNATSYHSIRTDMRNAGADWRDAEVVVDNGIITSRSPDDLPAFISKIVEEVEEGRHSRAA
mgnify:CR=1 FL=1|jgi:protease I